VRQHKNHQYLGTLSTVYREKSRGSPLAQSVAKSFLQETIMLNFAVVSVTAVGASLVSLTSVASPSGQSEPGSLVVFGLGLLALAVLARRARDARNPGVEEKK
jgi:hypothetical protein